MESLPFDPAHAITIVADTPARLRPIDLYRLLNTFDGERQAELAAYVKRVRPDIAHKVDRALAEIAEDAE